MIDWKRVAELQEEIGADNLAEVADLFLDEAEGAVGALVGGLPSAEAETQLHFLKGSALNLGLSALAAVCHEAERLAAAGNGAEVDTAGIAAIFQSSRSSLLAWLSAEAAMGAA